jgi:hypothetical protein
MKNAQKHLNCPMYISFKQFKNRPELVPGLYCSKHDVWIKWLNHKDYTAIKHSVEHRDTK